jgi:hypothetical protein
MSADLEHAAGSEDFSAAHNPESAPASSAHMPGSHMPGAYDPGGQANGKGAPPAGATSEGAPGDDVLDVEVYWFGVNETALVEGYAGKR